MDAGWRYVSVGHCPLLLRPAEAATQVKPSPKTSIRATIITGTNTGIRVGILTIAVNPRS